MSDAFLTRSRGHALETGSLGAEPIARRKLCHEVLDRLLSRLRSGEFPPGAWLPSERELMRTYRVGRPAVREALQSLERMGLLAIVHGEGARVLPLTVDSVIEQISDTVLHLLSGSQDALENLLDARLMLESALVRHAAAHATRADVEVLREALETHRKSVDDPQRFLETDMAFHCAIAAVSRNPILVAVSQAMRQWLEKFHQESLRAAGAERATLADHVRIFERVAAGDPEGAATMVTRHLTRMRKCYGMEARSARTAAAGESEPSRGNTGLELGFRRPEPDEPPLEPLAPRNPSAAARLRPNGKLPGRFQTDRHPGGILK